MFLQEPAESPYDLRFPLFGFPIRVTWSFWVGALVFGFYLVQGMDSYLRETGPGLAALFALWGLTLFVSILVHELGHAFAFRGCGIESSVVLYHFGGLAIPRDSWAQGRSYSDLTAAQEAWIALAGPLAQIGSAMLLVGAFKLTGHRLEDPGFGWFPLGLGPYVGATQGAMIESPGLFALLVFYTWPGIVWALLNLVPVWPLDGGRVMRSMVLIFGGNTAQSLWISVIAAGAMALYGFNNGQMFLAILFISLAITNYQLLQHHGDWRY